MSLDPYADCPCGSGKKLKFCCHAISSEIQRVAKLQENNQTKMALQTLDGLEQSHPGNLWVTTSRAAILMGERRPSEARAALEPILEEHPDHPFAIALFATASFASVSYEDSKRAVHRAFQKCITSHPDVVNGLAIGIAALMHARRCFMAARQHLAFAMRVATEQEQQDIFLRLLELDSNGEVPFPFRGVHELATIEGTEEITAEALKAEQYSAFGCWDSAARLYVKLAESAPENARIVQNAALCHAWDGNEDAAAEAYHRAAELHTDASAAADCETLAQLLDLSTPDEAIRWIEMRFRVGSVARLLGQLDAAQCCLRLQLPPDGDGPQPAAVYELIERDVEETDEPLSLETLVRSIGQITVFAEDEASEREAEAIVVAREGDDAALVRERVTAASEEDLTPLETVDGGDDAVVDSLPARYEPVATHYYFPPDVLPMEKQRVENERWDRFLEEQWPNTSLEELECKTPLEAAGDESLRTKLSAATAVLDAFFDSHRRVLDVDALRERLKLEPASPIVVDEATPLNSLSSLEFQRLPVGELNDAQLSYTLNRALLIHHEQFLYAVLREVLKRPSCMEKVDLNRVYHTLADLAVARRDREEALEWIEKGCGSASEAEDPFREELNWRMRELVLRLEDHSDPKLPAVLMRLWDYYGKKLPQLRDYLTEVASQQNIEPPWNAAGALGGEATAASAGVWTPDSGGPEPEGDQKLWLPGQS